VYFVRTDKISRPVFATNATGAKVWEVTYLPFGGVRTSSGLPIDARFPGQWYQSESGLHQNWMRDYDPTTGRYIEPDPLGLIDGASVYGYVKQSPAMNIDPRGEDCRVIGHDKFGNELLDCNSGRPYCPPGEDCNWRNPTENIRDPWPEFDACVKACLEREPILDPKSWWPISKSYRAQCAIISGVTGKIFTLPFPGGRIVTNGCRRDLCEEECVYCEK
jgi:RHS repeat-associated protein